MEEALKYDVSAMGNTGMTVSINEARAKIKREMRRHEAQAMNGRLTETLRATHHGAAEALYTALGIFPIGNEDDEEGPPSSRG